MMPSCDQTGVPIHFHSSTTSGSASLMSLRILLRFSPRQSPSSAILFEMSSDADWPWLAPDFFMFSSSPSNRATISISGISASRDYGCLTLSMLGPTTYQTCYLAYILLLCHSMSYKTDENMGLQSTEFQMVSRFENGTLGHIVS